MPDYQPIEYKDFVKGLNASTARPAPPPGTVPRLSNMVLTRRGGLVTCDGSQIQKAFNGIPTANRGRAMTEFLFSPIGVSPYYLRLMEGLGYPIGAPFGLVASPGGSGILAAGTYGYVVTALDGVGGESKQSLTVTIVTPANGANTLTWNQVPNAASYNVYRGSAISQTVLIGAGLPVIQIPNSTTATFTDTGMNQTGVGTPIALLQTVVTTAQAPEAVISLPTTGANTTASLGLGPGLRFVVAGQSDSRFNGAWISIFVIDAFTFAATGPVTLPNVAGATSTGGTAQFNQNPPTTDTTQQTLLIQCSTPGISYNDGSIVGFFPATVNSLGGANIGAGGGSGRIGGISQGNQGQQGSTPSGGVPGNVMLTPQMLQFANLVVIALGNAYPLQLFRDNHGTQTNAAPVISISAISVDSNGVVTVVTNSPHGLTSAQLGANLGVTTPLYSTTARGVTSGPFGLIQVVNPTTLKYVNFTSVGLAPSSGGFLVINTTPVISTFTTAYPTWITATTYLVGDIVIPTAPNGHFYKCVQAGVSGASQPTFPTTTGQQVPDATVIWQEAGLTNANAPPPPGAAHIAVFAGALWAWDTWYTDTINGLDGPTCLRMSDLNNPNSWNPINQAFIDKDDGTEGMGIAAFTITGFGIPPEGSLIAFKNYAGYQIVGVFGSANFLIQRIKSNCGCLAPRSIQFLTGYGLVRFSHLGFTLFDGINDRVISEEIKDYIFPSNDEDIEDITKLDWTWMPVGWGSQCVFPPMYLCAMPIGTSGGALTRLFAYDLVLKCWAGTIDIPFPISTLYQALPVNSTAVTVMGTFNDGALHRVFAGDETWDNSISVPGPSMVSWSVQPPELFVKGAQNSRFYCKEMIIRGNLNDPATIINATLEIEDSLTQAVGINQFNVNQTTGLFILQLAVQDSGMSMIFAISGSGPLEIDSFMSLIAPDDVVVMPVLT